MDSAETPVPPAHLALLPSLVLVDLEDTAAGPSGRRYVPQWNSVVAFKVPRYHAVTALTTDRPRYSVSATRGATLLCMAHELGCPLLSHGPMTC